MKYQTAFLAIAAACLAAPSIAQETLKLGNEGTYPPFSITNSDGSLTGMEPELARALCERLGATCEIEAMEFRALLPSLSAGKIDVIATQLTPKPERLENSEFTQPIIENPTQWVVAENSDVTLSADGLDGKTIGVIKGAWYIDPLRAFAPGAEVKTYDNINAVALDLDAGRIDMAIGGRVNWARKFVDGGMRETYELRENTAFEGGGDARSWAVGKGNTELRDRIDTALEEMFADCTYTEIRATYIPVPISEREPQNCIDASS